jgi:hypothetical protein
VLHRKERGIATKIGKPILVIVFTNKVSHEAKREAAKAAKSRNIPLRMLHSCGFPPSGLSARRIGMASKAAKAGREARPGTCAADPATGRERKARRTTRKYRRKKDGHGGSYRPLNENGMNAFHKGYYEDALYFWAWPRIGPDWPGPRYQEARIRNNIGLVFRAWAIPPRRKSTSAGPVPDREEGRSGKPLHAVVAANLRDVREAV